jgi:CheY-like chemotaxis protein
MAELHKGSVSLESEPDQGSRFTVSIPWKISGQSEFGNLASSNEVAASNTELGKKSQVRHSENQKILLVEDDKINAKIYLDCISSMNLPVILAVNGHEAIERCQELNPALILMDIQLPGMDGLTAIQHIRKMPKMKDATIIALTALAMAGDRDRCLKAGADMYLSKPVPLSTLKKVIRSYIEGSITSKNSN